LHAVDELPKLNELGKVDFGEGVVDGDVCNPIPVDDGLLHLTLFSLRGFKNLLRRHYYHPWEWEEDSFLGCALAKWACT
jgi:hypothetical protein